MSNRRKIVSLVSTGVLASSLLLGGGVAFAGTNYTNFSTTIGAAGAAAYTNDQTKAIDAEDVRFNPTMIGANRTISARMYRISTGGRGTERTGIAEDDNVALKNSWNAGTKVRTEIAGNFTWLTSTQVDGRWKSN